MSAYLVHGRRMSADDADFADQLAIAHAERHRPLCLCAGDGHEMYVARLGDTFFLKRLPYTGSLHAPECPSYEPPPELSGRGAVLGSAIREDPSNGIVLLRLGFSLSKAASRAVDAAAPVDRDSVVSDGARLTLRGLLHYLWDEAGLTRWRPGFAGKRSWGTVRRLLLQAAANKILRGKALADRLYVPEPFCVEERDAIRTRRLSQWTQVTGSSCRRRDLMLVIGEVKEIAPARFGFNAILKHLPDQALSIDEQLYRRMERRFETALSLWGSTSGLHMILIATFGVNDVGVPVCEELSLMPSTPQWLPVEDAFEIQLLERLSNEGRSFTKALRYNLGPKVTLASAILLDTATPCPLHVVRPGSLHERAQDQDMAAALDALPVWRWNVNQPMPALPGTATR